MTSFSHYDVTDYKFSRLFSSCGCCCCGMLLLLLLLLCFLLLLLFWVWFSLPVSFCLFLPTVKTTQSTLVVSFAINLACFPLVFSSHSLLFAQLIINEQRRKHMKDSRLILSCSFVFRRSHVEKTEKECHGQKGPNYRVVALKYLTVPL